MAIKIPTMHLIQERTEVIEYCSQCRLHQPHVIVTYREAQYKRCCGCGAMGRVVSENARSTQPARQ